METAIFYNCDLNFLHPTLISILSLRKCTTSKKAHIYIALEHDNDFDITEMDGISSLMDVSFISVNRNMQYAHILENWGKGRIPPITLLKFHMFDFLPSEISKIIYIDPDTLIAGDIGDLFRWPVQPGTIGVVEDALSFYESDWTTNGRFVRSYRESLGLEPADGYFNAGVILSDRTTWKDLSQEALAYLSRNQEKCIHLDQSAMNAVVAGHKTALSPIWNYQSRFRFWGSVPGLTPRIYHFTGAMKAWLGRLEPWLDVHDEILEFSRQITEWGYPRPALSPALIYDHNIQFHSVRSRLRRKFDYRIKKRRSRLRELHITSAM